MRKKGLFMTAFAASLTLCAGAAAAETPLFRVGLMTDTHWRENEQSFERTAAALKVFKREKVDMICNIGDISDLHFPWAYRYYRQKLFPSIFPENPPQEIFVYANHDVLRHDEHGSAVKGNIPECFAAVRKELGVPHAPDELVVFKGYPFVVLQQFVTRETMQKLLAEAAAKFPEGPIFVLDHVPAPRTADGAKDMRVVEYDKYPRIVHIYGHVHTPLRDENSIWQGGHTEVSAGCLQNWRGALIGTAPRSKECYEFSIMDVYKDKLVFTRYSTEDGKAFKEPWIVPLPFDPATAPYRFDTRAKNTPAPEFPADAALKLACDKPFSALTVTWPSMTAGGEPYKFFVGIAKKGADGEFHEISRQDSYSEFYLAENKRKGKLSQKLSGGFFDSGVEYRISVTPVGFFGRTGKPLTAEFTAPADAVKTKLIFECKDPMKEMVFAAGLRVKTPLPVKNGFWQHESGNARLIIPQKYWKGAKGTRFRFTVDMDTRQHSDRGWTMVLRNPVPLKNGNNRIQMPCGRVDGQRYVIELAKQTPKFFYDLLIREGGPGAIRFKYVKLELLPNKR